MRDLVERLAQRDEHVLDRAFYGSALDHLAGSALVVEPRHARQVELLVGSRLLVALADDTLSRVAQRGRGFRVGRRRFRFGRRRLRRAGAPESPAPKPEAPTPNPEASAALRDAREGVVGQSYQQSRADKELYLARMARLDYERAAGQMVERAAVESAVEDVLVTLRQALDQIPHRLAPVLVGQDIDAIRLQLRTEIDSVRTALVANFKAGLRELAGESVEPTINL